MNLPKTAFHLWWLITTSNAFPWPVKLKYLFIQGDATSKEILQESGICRAKTLIVALDHDANNAFLTLTARSLNAKLRIIARGEQPSTEKAPPSGR